MGFFRSLHEVNQQAKEIDRTWDRKAMRENAMSRMAAMQETMAEQTRAANLALSGRDATVTVVAARQTSARVNFDPVIEIDLTVMPVDGPPYPATVRQIVSQLYLTKVQPGASLRAKVGADDRQAIWIDLAAS